MGNSFLLLGIVLQWETEIRRRAQVFERNRATAASRRQHFIPLLFTTSQFCCSSRKVCCSSRKACCSSRRESWVNNSDPGDTDGPSLLGTKSSGFSPSSLSHIMPFIFPGELPLAMTVQSKWLRPAKPLGFGDKYLLSVTETDSVHHSLSFLGTPLHSSLIIKDCPVFEFLTVHPSDLLSNQKMFRVPLLLPSRGGLKSPKRWRSH